LKQPVKAKRNGNPGRQLFRNLHPVA
jgi:hypothetical protein